MTIVERILKVLTDNGVNPITAQFVAAQAAHETGNFTSVVFFANNNCFGMRPPQQYIIAIGENLGYAKYKSVEDSAKAMAIYLQAHNLSGGLQTLTSYVNRLHSEGYFEDSIDNYLKGVTHWYNIYFPTK